MTISEVIREVQRMIGDSSGEIVSKEFLLQCINEEAQRVAARYRTSSGSATRRPRSRT